MEHVAGASLVERVRSAHPVPDLGVRKAERQAHPGVPQGVRTLGGLSLARRERREAHAPPTSRQLVRRQKDPGVRIPRHRLTRRARTGVMHRPNHRAPTGAGASHRVDHNLKLICPWRARGKVRSPAREAFCPTVKRGWKKKFNTTRVADASSFFSFLDGRFLSQDIEGRSTPPAAGCFARPSRHRRAVSLFRPALGRERRVPSAAPRFRLGASGFAPRPGARCRRGCAGRATASRARSARGGEAAARDRGEASDADPSGDVVLRRSRTPPRGAATSPPRSAADLPARVRARRTPGRTRGPESSSSPSPARRLARAPGAAARGAAPSRGCSRTSRA